MDNIYSIGTLNKELKTQLSHLSNKRIEEFILKHLKEDAKKYSELFCQQYSPGRKNLNPINKNPLTELSPLALFYRNAPTQACLELSKLLNEEGPEETARLFSVYATSAIHNGNKILEFAPREAKLILLQLLQKTSPRQLECILSQRSSVGNKQIEMRSNIACYLSPKDEDLTLSFLALLSKLNASHLLSLFESEASSSEYFVLMHILDIPVSEKIALALLRNIKKLNIDFLEKIIVGCPTLNKMTGENIFHPLFSHYSSAVIQEALSLLFRFNEEKIKEFLTSQKSKFFSSPSKTKKKLPEENAPPSPPRSPKAQSLGNLPQQISPLHSLFSRSDEPELAFVFLQKIKDSANLLPVLLTSVQGKNVLQLALKNNKGLFIWLFEQAIIRQLPCEKTIQALFKVIQESDDPEIAVLEQAASLFQAINAPSNQSPVRNSEQKFTSLLIKTPQIVHSQWSEGNTLLHLAAARGKLAITSLLLKHGASPDAQNNAGLTPLHLALKEGYLKTAEALISHPKASFFIPDSDGILPLEWVVQHANYSLMKTSLGALSQNNSEAQVALSFAAALKKFPQTLLAGIEFNNFLAQPGIKKETLSSCFNHYADTNQDACAAFLIECAKRFNSSSSSELTEAAKQFTLNNLQLLANKGELINKQAAKQQLILFLFSLSPDKLVSFLRSLSLNPEQHHQLELLLCSALVKPKIFSQLSQEEQEEIYTCFQVNTSALKNIASVHFQQNDLTLLSPIQLNKYASYLTGDELFTISQSRRNGSIFVLALSKLLKEEPKNETKIAEMVQLLHEELKLFNQEDSSVSNNALFQMLNLARDAEVKYIIQTYLELQPNNAPLRAKLNHFFTEFKNQQTIIEQSFLRDWLIKNSNNLKVTILPRNQGAVQNVLAIAKPYEVKSILDLHSQSLISSMAINSLFSTDNEQSAAAVHWFRQLEIKTQRVELIELIGKIEALHERIKEACEKKQISAELKRKFVAIRESLSNFSLTMAEIYHKSITPIWNENTEKQLALLQQHFNNANKIFASFTEKQREDTVSSNTWKNLEQTLFQEVIKTCKSSDSKYQQHESAINEAVSFKPQLQALKPLLSAGSLQEQPEIMRKAKLFQEHVNSTLSHLTPAITAGILANPQRELLLMPLFTWHLRYARNEEDKKNFLTMLPQLLATTSQTAWVEVEKLLDKQLYHFEAIQWLLTQLRILDITKESNIRKIFSILGEADEKVLKHLIEFLQAIPQADLLSLAKAALLSKTQEIPEDLWLHNFPNEQADKFLTRTLNAIDGYSCQLLTTKAIKDAAYFSGCHISERLNNFSQLIDSITEINEAGLLVLINSYLPILEENLFSKDSQKIIALIASLLKKINSSSQITLLGQLSPHFVECLMRHSLSGLHSDDTERAEHCKFLVSCLSQVGIIENPTSLAIIKAQLGAQDLSLFKSEALVKLATNILTEQDNSLEDATINGVWIQRLLTSPRFIAACDPKTIQLLIERYRFISLTLKQDEFENLNKSLSKHLAFGDHHRASINRLQRELAKDPKSKAALIAKRERLLKFRADDAVRALLTQLEDNCRSLSNKNSKIANAALHNLYTHYYQQLSGMRSDLLFRITNFIYSRTLSQNGDLEQTQNVLYQWLESYLPHHNFTQNELSQKEKFSVSNKVNIYDKTGKELGFINEANYAFTFIDDIPSPLLELPEAKTGMPLYDNQRKKIGVLSATGEVKYENLFQKDTAALLIATVPSEQLGQAKVALDLLLHDVLTENAVDTLYSSEAVLKFPEKRQWVDNQLSQTIAGSKRPIAPESIEAMLKHQSKESSLALLGESQHFSNGNVIFASILNDEQKRHALFEESSSFNKFLDRFSAKEILADFLLQHHDKPWFNQGLSLFSQYANNKGQTELLNNALILLGDRVEKSKITNSQCESILNTLVSKETTAKIVLGFLGDTGLAIQKARTPSIDNFTSLLSKAQITPTITSLNNESYGTHSARYRLMLFAFAAHQKNIFQARELRYSQEHAWLADDLKQITQFVVKHLKIKKYNPDQELTIGRNLLGELVFRTANFGQTDLFYSEKGELDIAIASYTLKRSLLDVIATYFYIPEQVHQRIKQFFASLAEWFNNEHSEQKEVTEFLKDNQALMDWQKMASDSWSLSTGTELPIICAYALNYSGPQETITKLFQDYFASVKHISSEHMHCLARLMTCAPSRDVSKLIFAALEKNLATQPALLDDTLFHYMAKFYAKIYYPIKKPYPFQGEMELIKHFGQQKKYGLVEQCTEILLPKTQKHPLIEQRLKQINKEARIEKWLNFYVTSWFFFLLQIVTRWWHYTNKPSSYIKFCDESSPYRNPERIPHHIKTPVLDGQQVEANIKYAKKAKHLKQRVDAVIRKELMCNSSQNEDPVNYSPCRMFHHSQSKPKLDGYSQEEKTQQIIASC